MGSGPEDVRNVLNEGVNYVGYSGTPIPTDKDFFVAPLFVPDQEDQSSPGHFITGVFQKQPNGSEHPYKLYVFDSCGFRSSTLRLGYEEYDDDAKVEIEVPVETLNKKIYKRSQIHVHTIRLSQLKFFRPMIILLHCFVFVMQNSENQVTQKLMKVSETF